MGYMDVSTVKTIPLETNIVSCTCSFKCEDFCIFYFFKPAYYIQVYLSSSYFTCFTFCPAWHLCFSDFCMGMSPDLSLMLFLIYKLLPNSDYKHPRGTSVSLPKIKSIVCSQKLFFSCRTFYKTWGSVNYSCDVLLYNMSSWVCNLRKVEGMKGI